MREEIEAIQRASARFALCWFIGRRIEDVKRGITADQLIDLAMEDAREFEAGMPESFAALIAREP